MTRAGAVALLLLSLGCDEAARDDLSVAEPVAVEADWATQLSAVRDGRSDTIELAEATVTAQQFGELADRCEGLKVLSLERADLADEDLTVLASLPRLRWLKLPTPVGDRATESVVRCRELEIVNLPGATFTDAGLARIASLEGLTLLRFGSPNVTDEGLKPLTNRTTLRFLHLLDVPITDTGFDRIASIPALESFYLDGGRTTDDGLRRLLAARSDLHVHKDEAHLPGDPNADVHE